MSEEVKVKADARVDIMEHICFDAENVLEDNELQSIAFDPANIDAYMDRICDRAEWYATGKDAVVDNVEYNSIGEFECTVVSSISIDKTIAVSQDMSAKEFLDELYSGNYYGNGESALSYVDIYIDGDITVDSEFWNESENRFELGDESEVLNGFEFFKDDLFNAVTQSKEIPAQSIEKE